MIHKKQKHIFTDIQKPALRTKGVLGVSNNSHLSNDSHHKRPSLQSILSPLVILVYIFFTISVLFLPGEAKAVSYTWDGGGSTNDWSDCANWTTDTCPGSTDTVTFNSTSTKDSVVDSGFAGVVTDMFITTGYSGTVSQARSLNVTHNFTQNVGTYTASSYLLDVDSAFSLTGGTFTASSGTTSIGGSFSITGSPTFNNNGGTVTFDTSTGSIGCNNVTFNLVTFGSIAAFTKTVNSDCNLPLGNNPTIPTALTLSGTLTGTGTLNHTTNTLRINSTGVLSGFGGLNTAIFTIDAATVNLGSYSPVDINGAFTLQNGATFTAPSGTATFASTFTLNSGTTFNANGGTVTFDGSSSSTLSCNSASFNLVTFAHTAGTKTVSSNCSLPLGANPSLPTGMTVNGALSGTGTLTTVSITFNAGSVLSGFSGLVSNGTFNVTGATMDLSSYTTADFNGAFTLSSSGVFTAPTGNISFGASFTLNSGTTFNANGGTVTFDGSVTAVLSCNSTVFASVVIAHTSATRTINSDCNLPLGNNPTIGSGTTADIVLNGTLSGTGALTVASQGTGNLLTLNSGASLSGFDSLEAGALTIIGDTESFSSYTNFDVDGAFTLSSSAVFTAPSGLATFASTFTLNSGTTFNANGGTVTFDGAGATLSCNNVAFNMVVFAQTSGTKTVGSDCNLPLGANPTAGATSAGGGIALSGTLSGTGTLTTTSNTTLTLNSGAVLSGFGGLVSGGTLTISGATVDFSSYSPVDVDGQFILSSGAVFTAPTGIMSVASNFTINSGTTFNHNNGNIIFDGTVSNTLSCNNIIFNIVSLTHTGGNKTVSSNCSLPLGSNPAAGNGGGIRLEGTLSGSGTLTTTSTLRMANSGALSGFSGLNSHIFKLDNQSYDFSSFNTFDIDSDFELVNNAAFTATSANMTIGGNLSVLDTSTFSHNNGTVILDGSDQSVVGTTFNNFTKICATACTLTMPAGSTETILGTLTLQGAAGQLLSIVSSTPGSPWYIDAQGTRNLAYLAVSDSVSINATAMQACNSVDAGGNSNWVFNGSACSSSGASSSGTLASTGDNTNAIYIVAVVLILIGLFGVSVGSKKPSTKTN